jgi:hypothetical protein
MPITATQQITQIAANIDIFNFWDATNRQPTWHWSLILGGVVGALIASLISKTQSLLKLPVFFYKFFFKKSAIIGYWNVYHWSYLEGNATLIKSQAKVRRGFTHAYVVTLHQNVSSKLSYEGYIDSEKDQLVAKFKSTDHHENLVVRMRDPLGKASEKLAAIWLGYDHEGDVASGGLLLSRQDISELEAASEISKRIDNPSDSTVMGLLRL